MNYWIKYWSEYFGIYPSILQYSTILLQNPTIFNSVLPHSTVLYNRPQRSTIFDHIVQSYATYDTILQYCNSRQHSILPYSALQPSYSPVFCSIRHYSNRFIQCSTACYHIIPNFAVCYSILQYSIPLYAAMQYFTIFYSLLQHFTIFHNILIIFYSILQCSHISVFRMRRLYSPIFYNA